MQDLERMISVVLADDDEAYLETLRELVEQQPNLHVVGVALDGLEAIECVESIDPDALVIDLRMPRMDGVAAVGRLRQEHRSLCLIAITGDDDPELHRSASDAGADAVMLKSQLLEGLAEQIETARRKRAAVA
ncbi:MAG TPA: response regulator transcription factor [Gaiellaceae bacterium]|jgi:DNA-binding NarL/FixJ family response regulator|nr:response regulator transcription factor [Gaiellaceae bacterium]